MDIRTIQNCLDVEPPLEQEEHLSAQQIETEGSMGTILSSLFARSTGMNLDMSFQAPCAYLLCYVHLEMSVGCGYVLKRVRLQFTSNGVK